MATVVGVSGAVDTTIGPNEIFQGKSAAGEHDSTSFAIYDPDSPNLIYVFEGTGFGNYDSNGIPHTGTITAMGIADLSAVIQSVVTDITIPMSQLLPIINSNSADAYHDLLYSGDDTLLGDSGADKLYGYGGNDTIFGDSLAGEFGANDTLHGGDGDDLLDGYGGGDKVYGDAGDDVIEIFGNEIGPGELADGGAGTDILVAFGETVDLRNTTLVGFERLALGLARPEDISVEVVFKSTQFGGGAMSANLEVAGSIGFDTVTVMAASAGASVDLSGWTFFDWNAELGDHVEIIGNTGAETLTGTYLDDDFNGGAGNDTFNGGDGFDLVVYENATSGVTVDLSAASPHDVGGGQGSDTYNSIEGIVGSNYIDHLTGDAGDNLLDGGGHGDFMAGGDGNDVYIVRNGAEVMDVIIEGTGPNSGIDSVLAISGYSIADAAGVENLTLLNGGDAIGNDLDNILITFENDSFYVNILSGGGGNDSLYGSTLADSLDGGTGADLMDGGGGADEYYVDNIGDVIVDDGSIEARHEGDTVHSSISYVLADGLEKLFLSGTDDINATGNAQDNYLSGNDGDNILDGGAGADVLSGEGGYNTFYVDNVDDVVTGNGVVKASVSYVLYELGSTERLELYGAALNGTGNDVDNTIIGNANANVLDGGFGNDILDGGLGADTMIGGRWMDTFYVDNAGDAVIETDAFDHYDNDDKVYTSTSWTMTSGSKIEFVYVTGVSAIDVTGNAENNNITGNSAANTLRGGGGTDTLNGGLGIDTLWGDAGNDNLNGGVGADVMRGGVGDDTYTLDQAGDSVVEGANQGIDTIRTSFTYSLINNTENLVLTGSAAINGTGNSYNNRLTGNDAANVLNGGFGDDTLLGGGSGDTLNGGAGVDTMSGGAGDDFYYLDVKEDRAIETLNAGVDTLSVSWSLTLGANFENLVLTGSAAINATGNAYNNTLTGNDGNNVLNGKTGADTMYGGLGDDTYYVDDDADVTSDTGGIDLVRSSTGNYTAGAGIEKIVLTEYGGNATGNELDNTITGNMWWNHLDGGLGADRMAGGGSGDFYTVDNVGDLTVEGATGGFDTVYSSISWTLQNYTESLELTGTANLNGTGNSQNNWIYGNSGDNILNGKAGSDRMEGGFGDDLYYFDNDGDSVWEQVGQGHDTIRSTVSVSMSGGAYNVEDLYLLGTDAIDGSGNGLSNRITGNSAANVIDGMGGGDMMLGGGGDDIYYVRDAADRTIDNGGVDTVRAYVSCTLENNIENLELLYIDPINGTGNSLSNKISGNDAANILIGGGGDDTLNGGYGADALEGDAGADTFVFNSSLTGGNVDMIVDFATGVDKIQLENAVFQGIGGVGALAANKFVVGAAALDANDFIIYNPATGALSYDADGSGAGSAVQFATLGTGMSLSASDFLVM